MTSAMTSPMTSVQDGPVARDLPPHEQIVAALELVRADLEKVGFAGFDLDTDGCDCCAGADLTLPTLAGKMRTYTSGRGRGPLVNGWVAEVDIEDPDGGIHAKTQSTVRSPKAMAAFFRETLLATARERGLLPGPI